MKKFVIGVMIIQVMLFFIGIFLLFDGDFYNGIFNISANFIGLLINFNNIKRL